MSRNRGAFPFFIYLWGAGALAACSGSSSDDGGADDGGAADQPASDTADAGAGDESSGDGKSTGAGPCTPPECLLGLLASCPAEGECVQQIEASEVHACFANGVKSVITNSGGGSANDTYKPDGTLCYSTSSSIVGGGKGTAIVWRDPKGIEVASAFFDLGSFKTTYTCKATGAMKVVDVKACSAGGGDAGAGCSTGECQAP